MRNLRCDAPPEGELFTVTTVRLLLFTVTTVRLLLRAADDQPSNRNTTIVFIMVGQTFGRKEVAVATMDSIHHILMRIIMLTAVTKLRI
jgi:hypothetical protein